MGCTSSSSVVDIRRTVVKSGSSLVVWSITEHERDMIKRTWRILSRKLCDVGSKVFLEIFSRRPDIQHMFEFRNVDFNNLLEDSSFKRHVNRVMQTIGALVDNIEDLDTTMAPILSEIGYQHFRLPGFDLDLCDLFISSLLKTWRRELGRRYTTDVGCAWKQLFDFMVVKLVDSCRSEID